MGKTYVSDDGNIWPSTVLSVATLSLMIDADLITADQAIARLDNMVALLPERLRTLSLLEEINVVTASLRGYPCEPSKSRRIPKSAATSRSVTGIARIPQPDA